MTNKYLEYYLGIFIGMAIVSFPWWLTSKYGIKPEPVLTCEVVETKIWATQQCLKFQPGCKMNKGPQTFTEYKRNKDWVAEHCPKNGDGFQS